MGWAGNLEQTLRQGCVIMAQDRGNILIYQGNMERFVGGYLVFVGTGQESQDKQDLMHSIENGTPSLS